MRSKAVAFALTALALATLPAGARRLEAQAPGYVIVVNPANPVASLSRDEASKLFLKKTPRWSTGAEVVPVDLPEGSAVREAFTKSVLKKSVGAVKSYWQQQIFSGRGVPPTEKGSDAEVVSFVRSNPHAIGYVSATTPVGSSVKVVAVRSN
jgi:ABC-type phosphate transport system substrate-binding protein